MPLPPQLDNRLRLPVIAAPPEVAEILESAKAWRDLWSAGHGVSVIDDVPTTAELVERLEVEYRAACEVEAFEGR